MASSYVLENIHPIESVRQLAFAGDGVRLAGQIEYPSSRPSQIAGNYPLLFILHSAGWNTRTEYNHYARIASRGGFAVFRWDKRGNGRSGAGGRGSTSQDAVHAYETALDQPRINHNKVVILAQGEGSLMLGQSFGLFARLQKPAGVILAGNMLDEHQISAIDAPVQIINGEKDWRDWSVYARAAAEAHGNASYYVAQGSDRTLHVNGEALHVGAMQALHDWLKQFDLVYR